MNWSGDTEVSFEETPSSDLLVDPGILNGFYKEVRKVVLPTGNVNFCYICNRPIHDLPKDLKVLHHHKTYYLSFCIWCDNEVPYNTK